MKKYPGCITAQILSDVFLYGLNNLQVRLAGYVECGEHGNSARQTSLLGILRTTEKKVQILNRSRRISENSGSKRTQHTCVHCLRNSEARRSIILRRLTGPSNHILHYILAGTRDLGYFITNEYFLSGCKEPTVFFFSHVLIFYAETNGSFCQIFPCFD